MLLRKNRKAIIAVFVMVSGAAVLAFQYHHKTSFLRTNFTKQFLSPCLTPHCQLNSSLSRRYYRITRSMMNEQELSFIEEIGGNLSSVQERIRLAAESTGANADAIDLVAVSKIKPVEALQAAYDCGQRRFGENYVQEICEKAPQLPEDILWHFIGPLQSNKAKALVKGVPNLAVVETVASEKVANRLDAGCEEAGRETPLDVFLQVDTSGEDTKSGLPAGSEQLLALARRVAGGECPRLRLAGVMTIGAPGDLGAFDRLVESRAAVAAALGLADPSELRLSMGMSGDFEEAVARGSTNVRVGTTIFGQRDYSKKK